MVRWKKVAQSSTLDQAGDWTRCRRDFAPQGFAPPPPPPPRSLVIWPSPGSLRSLGIWPPLKFRDFAPPFLHFRSSYFLYIIGVKNNGRKLGNFDTCTNYSRCSQRNTLISCRLCVRGSAKCIFIFCEFRWIANMKFKKNLLVLSLSLNYFCLKQTSWKFGNTDN